MMIKSTLCQSCVTTQVSLFYVSFLKGWYYVMMLMILDDVIWKEESTEVYIKVNPSLKLDLKYSRIGWM